MNYETKREMLKLVNMLPDYRDPAWNDDPDGCKLDVDHAKRRLLEIVQPSNNGLALNDFLVNAALDQRSERGE